MSQHLTVKLALAQVSRPRGTLPEGWEDLKVRAAELRKEGANYSAIGRALSLTTYLVRRALVEMGITTEHVKFGCFKLNVPKERIEELIAQGMTRNQMCTLLGITNRSMLTLLARYGLVAAGPDRVNQALAKEGKRRCCTCKEIKALAVDFYAQLGSSEGRSYRCKKCSKNWLRIFKQRLRQRKQAARARTGPLTDTTGCHSPESDGASSAAGG